MTGTRERRGGKEKQQWGEMPEVPQGGRDADSATVPSEEQYHWNGWGEGTLYRVWKALEERWCREVELKELCSKDIGAFNGKR